MPATLALSTARSSRMVRCGAAGGPDTLGKVFADDGHGRDVQGGEGACQPPPVSETPQGPPRAGTGLCHTVEKEETEESGGGSVDAGLAG
jgi:hypothetical protein